MGKLFNFDICEEALYKESLEKYKKNHPESADNINIIQDPNDKSVFGLFVTGACENLNEFFSDIIEKENELRCVKYTINGVPPRRLFVAKTEGYNTGFLVQNKKRLYDTDEEAYDVLRKIDKLTNLIAESVLYKERNDMENYHDCLKKISEILDITIMTTSQAKENLNKGMTNFVKGKD